MEETLLAESYFLPFQTSHPIDSFSFIYSDIQSACYLLPYFQGDLLGQGHDFFMSGIVFVHRKGMDFKVRHGLYIEKGHDLLVQAWSLYIERAWFIKFKNSPFICLFIHCLGSHQDVCWSGIVCAHPQVILNPTDKRPHSFFIFTIVKNNIPIFFISRNGSFGFMSHTYCFF